MPPPTTSNIPPNLHILLLDNHDSYTFNLVQLIAELNHGRPPTVVANDADVGSLSMLLSSFASPIDAIVVSPGPGSPDRPEDFGLCAQAYDCGLPVLGVCLGHQGMALAFGGRVVRAPEPVHGRVAQIVHTGSSRLLEGIASPFGAVRYHSLVVDEHSLPSCLRVTARTADDARIVMAMEHTSRPLFGVQYHPESICTEYGDAMLSNFLRVVASERGKRTHTAVGPSSPSPSPSSPLPSPPSAATPLPPPSPPRCLLVCEPALSRALSPQEVFSALLSPAACSFWLDAADDRRQPYPYSYMGCSGGPHSSLLCQHRDGTVERTSLAASSSSSSCSSSTSTRSLDGAMRAELAPWANATILNSSGRQATLPSALAFRGGLVGFFGYEAWHTLGPAARATELRRRRPETTSNADSGGGGGSYADALASWLFADRLIAFDHRAAKIYLLCLCERPEAPSRSHQSAIEWLSRQARALARLASRPPVTPHASSSSPPRPGVARFVSDRDRDCYLHDIETIDDHLKAGESYEVCLTTTFRCKGEHPHPPHPPPYELYRHLRATNPAPHAAYLRIDPHRVCARQPRDGLGAAAAAAEEGSSLPRRAPFDALGPGGVAICCSSPERFLQVAQGSDGGGTKNRVECKPIKGTARRGATKEEDVQIAEALRTEEKTRSENLMIVDLIRNDLGRSCEYGSVHVPKLMAIESFATVHQLVSTIVGTLRSDEDALSVTAAAFLQAA